MKTAIENMADRVAVLVENFARHYGVPDDLGIDIVCAACCNNPDLAPSKRTKKIQSDEDAVLNWVLKFYNGYKSRPSVKTGVPPGTIPDPAVGAIIGSVSPSMSQDDLDRIVFAHRLSMSAENLLGPFLEEYVFARLKDYGWALAWGETVKSVDLCSRNGQLIQIKNRSNTENSSSNKVRVDTDIQIWYRVDANTGEYFWTELCDIAGVRRNLMSEADFRQYFRNALRVNPHALGVDEDNPWLSLNDPWFSLID